MNASTLPFKLPEGLRFEREGLSRNSSFEVPDDLWFDRQPMLAETIGELTIDVPEDLRFERKDLLAEPNFKGLVNRDLSFKVPDDFYFQGDDSMLTEEESARMGEWVAFDVPGDLHFDRGNLFSARRPRSPEVFIFRGSGVNMILDNVHIPQQEKKVGPGLPASQIGSISGGPPLTPEEIRGALDVERPLPLGLSFVKKRKLPTTVDDTDELVELDTVKNTINPSFETDSNNNSLAVVDMIIARDRQFCSGKRLEPFTEHARGPAMPQDAGQGPDSFQSLQFSLNEEKLRRFHKYICDMDLNWNDYEERVEKLVAMRTNQMLIEEDGHRVLVEVEKELNNAAEELDCVLQDLE